MMKIVFLLLIGISYVLASPCDLVRCPGNNVCKEKFLPCVNGVCKNETVPHCVPQNKRGICPVQELTETSSSQCVVDSDCGSNLKCCPHKENSYCFKPCRKSFCKCQAGMKMVYENNPKGCPVCNCIKEDLEARKLDVDVCSLPKVSGNCKARFVRFFYNPEAKRCEKFIFGGCNGNKNNFFKKEACENKCLPKSTQTKSQPISSKCGQDVAPGMCKGYLERYYFNQTAKECQKFIYGGCQGNENNFETKQECDQECNNSENVIAVKKFDKEACQLKQDSGPCFAHFEKYYFNTNTNKCERFVYGGCFGNANRFQTEQECQQSCEALASNNICKLEQDTGKCKGYFERYFYNETAKECQKFVYGGCDGNENNFQTKDLCETKCSSTNFRTLDKTLVCNLKKDSGPCLAYNEMFFFNKNTQKCEKFVYGGCQGNENRFNTEEECQNSCSTKSFTKDKCKLKSDSGLCRSYLERYFYNDTAKECQKFIYGGCNGNENNFKTLDSCLNECSTDKAVTKPFHSSFCSLQKDSGPCFAYMKKFFYNSNTNKCEQFVYGGCQGNENRFDTEEECQHSCQNSVNYKVIDNNDICNLEKNVGQCRGYNERYFFNKTAQQCQQFIYSGCKGNANNFKNLEDCNMVCSKSVDLEIPEKIFDQNSCYLEKAGGLCYAYIPSFYFNSKSGECESFIYGGCGGNENRFQTFDMCEKSCKKVNKDLVSSVNKCDLKPVTGKCRAYFKKYYYDKTENTCHEFVYGGCGGNDNRFETEEMCMNECSLRVKNTRELVDPCREPKKTGMCMAYFERYFYNNETKKCEKFVYGGCQANGNNFETIDECEQRCRTN